MTGHGTDPVRIRISDPVVTRVAARRALAVPGVLALQADIGQTMLGVAGSVFGQDTQRRPPAGASATVRDGTVTVELTVVSRLGYNCRDLAQEVQREVAEEVAGYTGLLATVVVTVADVLIDPAES